MQYILYLFLSEPVGTNLYHLCRYDNKIVQICSKNKMTSLHSKHQQVESIYC